jgi:hypothetical protein
LVGSEIPANRSKIKTAIYKNFHFVKTLGTATPYPFVCFVEEAPDIIFVPV